jgi:hypothetical protein
MTRQNKPLMTCPTCDGTHKVMSSRGVWDRCPTCRPSARAFDCPDCAAKSGEPCRSARGNRLPGWHNRRLYLMQDAAAKWAP